MWLDMVDGGYKSFLYSVLSRDKWVCSEISSHVMMCYCAREKKPKSTFRLLKNVNYFCKKKFFRHISATGKIYGG